MPSPGQREWILPDKRAHSVAKVWDCPWRCQKPRDEGGLGLWEGAGLQVSPSPQRGRAGLPTERLQEGLGRGWAGKAPQGGRRGASATPRETREALGECSLLAGIEYPPTPTLRGSQVLSAESKGVTGNCTPIYWALKPTNNPCDHAEHSNCYGKGRGREGWGRGVCRPLPSVILSTWGTCRDLHLKSWPCPHGWPAIILAITGSDAVSGLLRGPAS